MQTNKMEQLCITTPRLLVRQLQQSDLSDFHLYRSNPEVTKYQGFDVMTEEQAATFIHENAGKTFGKAGEWVQYAIANKETGRLTGDCAIKLDQHDMRIAEIGITISHLSQNRGYAGEVMTGLLGFLFDEQGIHRVVEIVDAENAPCIRMLQRTGFRQEGHFNENIFFKGKWGSEYQFAMLQKEWRERKNSQ